MSDLKHKTSAELREELKNCNKYVMNLSSKLSGQRERKKWIETYLQKKALEEVNEAAEKAAKAVEEAESHVNDFRPLTFPRLTKEQVASLRESIDRAFIANRTVVKRDRYSKRNGKFGAYFYDELMRCDLTLDDVLHLLNK